ncbi:MAG: hypothetical protein AAGE59_03060 [Cyanobacteria bacterium P01_F01_bin.86]
MDGISVILVPVGAESRAVKQALKTVQNAPQVVEIPAGPQAVTRFLQTWDHPQIFQSGGVLLLGLGGSLSPALGIGDGVLVEQILAADSAETYACDRTLTAELAAQLGMPTAVGVTCDRVITTAVEKRALRDRYGADVVDMEAAAILRELPDCRMTILRVISDDCHHDLPDIAGAIGVDGSIKVLPMALSFLKHPVAALRLIRSALRGLKCLEFLTRRLYE